MVIFFHLGGGDDYPSHFELKFLGLGLGSYVVLTLNSLVDSRDTVPFPILYLSMMYHFD
jgi:hypothetical protein